MSLPHKQNVTVSLTTQTICKAKILFAQRSTSISGLLSDQVAAVVSDGERYRD
jgi:hypothetical protein